MTTHDVLFSSSWGRGDFSPWNFEVSPQSILCLNGCRTTFVPLVCTLPPLAYSGASGFVKPFLDVNVSFDPSLVIYEGESYFPPSFNEDPRGFLRGACVGEESEKLSVEDALCCWWWVLDFCLRSESCLCKLWSVNDNRDSSCFIFLSFSSSSLWSRLTCK